MLKSDEGSSLEDIEFLVRSEHRITALDALAEGPLSRAELKEVSDASTSTVGRMLREFERRRWIRRDEKRYEATPLGAFVATGMKDLIDRIESERKFRDVWQWLPAEVSGRLLEADPDAVVTVAATTNPYRPVNRFVSLLRETENFRFVGFDLALLEPCNEELTRLIADGMHTEIIDPPHVAEYILSTYPKQCSENLESGTLTVWLHEELPPYGVSIFDDRIGITGYHHDSGTVRVLIDTEAPAARRWAESTYESYRREARPLAFESLAE